MQDNDNELESLSEALDTLHLKFYSQINQQPQVAQILPTIKQRVLAGCRIVFSGVFPLGKDPIYHELWISAIKFGAIAQLDIDETSTHLIAAKVGTVKCKKALEMKMWIVKPEWLVESISQWAKVLEKDYILDESFLDKGGYQVKADWDDMDNEVDGVLLDTSSEEEDGDGDQEKEECVNQGSQGSRATSYTDDDDWLALEIEAELNEPTHLGKRKHDE
jgi:RNA polymerase II subunit A-like phosphatase